ncbi:hypothetical protein CAI21_07675 [Alkalilimnicola ehrlichii]|uniref:Phage holin family protein n=1 Tax=Alkalilimnicola ehrlichii TaxID=351052 RepID=A0A3E0WYE8_9GAMM|nr:phage holin family protein [Alkalilimnicola ehrlichii]RFA30075.1 hypothetical protein CAI21_07675 [Alkalilimnicola ehrlichii]RFA37419.1 hypothetical protein CAL65_09015 [Alkalilimnicola ehrlichii]
MAATTPEKELRAAETAQSPSLKDRLEETLRSTRNFLAELFELFGLETRLAGLNAAKMLGLAIAAGFTLISGWLFLQGALVYWLHQLGLNLGLASLLFALINLAGTAGLAWWIYQSSKALSFPATRRALKKEAAKIDEQLATTDRSETAGGHPH